MPDTLFLNKKYVIFSREHISDKIEASDIKTNMKMEAKLTSSIVGMENKQKHIALKGRDIYQIQDYLQNLGL